MRLLISILTVTLSLSTFAETIFTKCKADVGYPEFILDIDTKSNSTSKVTYKNINQKADYRVVSLEDRPYYGKATGVSKDYFNADRLNWDKTLPDYFLIDFNQDTKRLNIGRGGHFKDGGFQLKNMKCI